MSKTLIQPRTLRGFRDFLPAAMMPREWLMETARRVYRSFGYAPIDTPALEYYEILAGKGGEESDRQMYQFVDHGERHVGMRFDLTVPLARFVAQHIDELGTPFKRYHIGTVWRGEKSQAGRYREFVQCDFDTIGTTAISSDVETGLVIHSLFVAIGFEAFTIRINHRKVLTGLLEKFELIENANHVLRAIDKLDKVGPARVQSELAEVGASENQIQQLLALVQITGSNEEVLKALKPLVTDNEIASQGLAELEEFNRLVMAAGVPEKSIRLDPSIARGLDYYTGIVFETVLDADPSIGSVCSGGRYDNLAELFTTRHLPGVGASLGLDRLLTAMERLEMVPQVTTPAQVLIINFDAERMADYLQIASFLRGNGIGVEVFPETKKLAQQFKYSDRRGFAAAIVAGSQEFERDTIQIKWLASGEQNEISINNGFQLLCDEILQRLNVTN